jgi:hypothetical protein
VVIRAIKTYRKVGAFYIAWEADLSIAIREPAAPGLFAGLVSGAPTYQYLYPGRSICGETWPVASTIYLTPINETDSLAPAKEIS